MLTFTSRPLQATPAFPGAPTVTQKESDDADSDVSGRLADLLTAQTALNSNTDEKKTDQLRTNVETARKNLSDAQQAQSKVMDALNKFNMANGDSTCTCG